MGAYYLTNSSDRLDAVTDLMAKKRLTTYDKLVVGPVTILNFHKSGVTGYDNLYREEQDFIIGLGTYYYGALFAEAALPRIWEDYKNGRNPFAEVGGHFNFIICRNGSVHLVTDKSGQYQALYATQGGTFWVSSSLMAIAASLGKLTPNKQAILEFINIEASFAGETVFTEIKHLEAGSIYALGGATLAARPYYDYHRDEPLEFPELIDRLTSYFQIFQQTHYSISCDLSGGYDSRTVASILTRCNIDFVFNTNTDDVQPEGPSIAQEIAQAANKDIELYMKDLSKYEYSALVDDCLNVLEVARDIYRSAYAPVYFHAKSRAHPIVLGGWGGELYRANNSTAKRLPELIERRYVEPGVRFRRNERKQYTDRLMDKFSGTLSNLGEHPTKKGVEKIYYWEFMRYWGAGHITAFNQYCFRLHPLLDHCLIRPLFDVPLSAKLDGQFQKRVITSLAPTLARIRSHYGNQPFTAGETKAIRRAVLEAQERAKYIARRVWRNSGLNHVSSARLPEYCRQRDDSLEDIIQLNTGDLTSSKAIGRYLTVAKVMGQLRLAG